jgi:hypothetical protein
MPFTPKMLQIKERTPIPSYFVIFIFKLAFESFKECGGASIIYTINIRIKDYGYGEPNRYKAKYVLYKLSLYEP